MPTYEYTCKQCGQTIEAFQSFSDKPLRKHKECGGELQKVFHARGVVFKGSGFYSTDSRSGKSEAPNGSTKKREEKKPAAAASSTTSDGD
jgi:putative FmdB family regulatory protein